MTNELPKLPEPHGWYLLTGHGNSYMNQRPQCLMADAWKPAYGAAQMQAYARAAVEQAKPTASAGVTEAMVEAGWEEAQSRNIEASHDEIAVIVGAALSAAKGE